MEVDDHPSKEQGNRRQVPCTGYRINGSSWFSCRCRDGSAHCSVVVSSAESARASRMFHCSISRERMAPVCARPPPRSSQRQPQEISHHGEAYGRKRGSRSIDTACLCSLHPFAGRSAMAAGMFGMLSLLAAVAFARVRVQGPVSRSHRVLAIRGQQAGLQDKIRVRRPQRARTGSRLAARVEPAALSGRGRLEPLADDRAERPDRRGPPPGVSRSPPSSWCSFFSTPWARVSRWLPALGARGGEWSVAAPKWRLRGKSCREYHIDSAGSHSDAARRDNLAFAGRNMVTTTTTSPQAADGDHKRRTVAMGAGQSWKRPIESSMLPRSPFG